MGLAGDSAPATRAWCSHRQTGVASRPPRCLSIWSMQACSPRTGRSDRAHRDAPQLAAFVASCSTRQSRRGKNMSSSISGTQASAVRGPIPGSVIFTHRPRYCLIACLRSQLLWRARGGGSSACRPSARSTRRARQQHGTDRRTSRRADESGTPQRTFRISQWCPRFRQRRREDLSESWLDVGIHR
jgi:hypothetical protein